MKLLEFNEPGNAEDTLKESLADAGDIRVVVVIELWRDGTQRIRASKSDHYERSFLKCFFDAWVLGWFDRTIPK